MILENITVLGVNQQPKEVLVNGKSLKFVYDKNLQTLHVNQINVSLLNQLNITF